MDTAESNEHGSVHHSTKGTSSEKLQTNEYYGQTEIWIRGNDEGGYAAGIGDYRITEVYPDVAPIKTILKGRSWKAIINLIAAMISAHHAHLQVEMAETIKNHHQNTQTHEQVPARDTENHPKNHQERIERRQEAGDNHDYNEYDT